MSYDASVNNPTPNVFEVEVIANNNLVTAVEEARQYAEDAENSADSASNSASSASASASNANNFANSASSSASSASASESTATTQAGIATTQAGIATTKANEASQSESNAFDSEQSSAQSASDALQSEQNAFASEQASAQSEANALSSQQSASASASTATTQAGIATTQAGIATTQAGIATTQASNALNSANAAAASAASAAAVGTSTVLTGFSVGANTAIAGTDTILQAFNKTQGQINARVSGMGVSGQVSFWTGTGTQSGDSGLVWDNSTKNLRINQLTDAGFRLDVNGTARVQGALSVTTGGASITGLSTIQGTTASDSGQLGSELLTTGTGDASWTGSSFATGYTHVAGSTTTLTSTLAGVVNNFYQITYTVTGRTAGSFTIAFGGQSFAGLTATGAVGPRATTTDTLVITPTSDFNGTIVLSIRVISASSASVSFTSSGGTATNHIRISSISSNTFYGREAGRLNTTGNLNTFIGAISGQFNTSGLTNSFFGNSSGANNTTGSNNSFFGYQSGLNNITGFGNSWFGWNSGLSNTTGNNNAGYGYQTGTNLTSGSFNVFLGRDAGRFIADGSSLTNSDNSTFIGFDARANGNSQTNQIAIGYQAIGLGSNTTVIGNSSTTFGRWWGSLLVGTSTNEASSILTLESTTKGFLPPRMTGAQAEAISSPAEGLLVYSTDGTGTTITSKGWWGFNGSTWAQLN